MDAGDLQSKGLSNGFTNGYTSDEIWHSANNSFDSWHSANMSDDMDDIQEIPTHLIPYPGHIQSKPVWEIVVKCLAYSIVILLALLGNMLVVIVVAQNKRMRNNTYYFLVNLAVSDIMVTSSCTWVHLVDDLTENWLLGAFFCKFNSFAQGKEGSG